MRDILQQIIVELRGIWRFRWTAMTVVWVVCIVGWFGVYLMPNVYSASAQVYVDADSRLAEVMGEVGVAPGVGASVFVVRQAMLGRPQLEQVAAKTGLADLATNEEEYEALMLYLRENIAVNTGRSSESRNLYTITFDYTDRLTAIAVVKEILHTFVTDVLKLKDKGAEDVTGYLDDQLSHYSGLLAKAEKDLASFKKTHVGLLPGESGGIFERLQVEIDLLDDLKQELRIEEDRREELRRQLQTETPYLPDGAQLANGVTITGTPTETSIRDLEARRANLMLSFTDKHPDVVALTEQLDILYKKRADELAMMANVASGDGAANATNPVYQSVQIAMNQAGVKIAGLRSQVNQHMEAVSKLNSQINTIPDIEAEFSQLSRNYDQYKELYGQLLLRKERERMGEAGEKREVVSFNITNPPAAEFEPVAPKRTFFLFAVLVLGLGLGATVALARHLMRPVFHDANSLRLSTGRPVLGAISMMWFEGQKRSRALGYAGFGISAAVLIAVFVSALMFQDVGVSALQGVLAN
jgi:polysaccharide chain length determinant protein (PEP-CTERM system associated)